MTTTIGEHRILVGDVLEQLATLEDESVQCVVTSPPYWGLRDYGTAEWEGGDAGCDHLGESKRTQAGFNERYFDRPAKEDKQSELRTPFKDVCGKCGARRIDAQLGLEPTPEAHVDAMVRVFREVRRVLRSDGVCWLNYGDCYAGAQGAGGGWTQPGYEGGTATKFKNERSTGDVKLGVPPSLKPKDLVGMPWRVAFALQADGWWLRSALPWVKRSAMPESCTDRPASALEYVFMLTRSSRYFADMEAVRQGGVCDRMRGPADDPCPDNNGNSGLGRREPTGTRAYRNTDLFYASIAPPHGMIFCGDEPVGLDVNPQPFSEAHFATFPEKLVEPLIRMGTSEKGCCPECGKAWVRVVETDYVKSPRHGHPDAPRTTSVTGRHEASGQNNFDGAGQPRLQLNTTTLGHRPACECRVDAVKVNGEAIPRAPIPCTVLDPFAGSGTTLLVANRLGRDAIGIELNEDYATMALDRIGRGLRPSTYRSDNGADDSPLFAGLNDGNQIGL